MVLDTAFLWRAQSPFWSVNLQEKTPWNIKFTFLLYSILSIQKALFSKIQQRVEVNVLECNVQNRGPSTSYLLIWTALMNRFIRWKVTNLSSTLTIVIVVKLKNAYFYHNLVFWSLELCHSYKNKLALRLVFHKKNFQSNYSQVTRHFPQKVALDFFKMTNS